MARFMRIGEFRVGQKVRIAERKQFNVTCKVGMQGEIIEVAGEYIDIVYDNNSNPTGFDSWMSYYENYEFELLEDVLKVGDGVVIEVIGCSKDIGLVVDTFEDDQVVVRDSYGKQFSISKNGEYKGILHVNRLFDIDKKEEEKVDMPVKNAEIKTELNVGDSVVVKKYIRDTLVGKTGTLKFVGNRGFGKSYGIEFDDKIKDGHDGLPLYDGFSGKKGHCYFLNNERTTLELLVDEPANKLTVKEFLSKVKFYGDVEDEIYVYVDDETIGWINVDSLDPFNDYYLLEINVEDEEIKLESPKKAGK